MSLVSNLRFSMMCLVYGHRLGYYKKVKIGDNPLFKIWVNGETLWIAREERVSRYIYGISARIEKVYRSYGIQNIALPKDVSVVDIGCNDGIFLANFVKSHARVIGIDLELSELFCAISNVPNSEVVRAGIWYENGFGSFESAPKGSDSSLIRSNKSEDIKFIPLLSLDQIIPLILKPNETLDILKIEAEGAEPEVLIGARESLKRVRYAAVDIGPERGPKQVSTGNSVTRILSSMGFHCIYTSRDGNRVLFQNMSLKAISEESYAIPPECQ